jgi:hypothetical protein
MIDSIWGWKKHYILQKSVLSHMNLSLAAAVVKRFGVQTHGGKYELFLTDSQLNSVNPGSIVQQVRDDVRGGVTLVLAKKPKVIDIQPITPAPPPQPPPSV